MSDLPSLSRFEIDWNAFASMSNVSATSKTAYYPYQKMFHLRAVTLSSIRLEQHPIKTIQIRLLSMLMQVTNVELYPIVSQHFQYEIETNQPLHRLHVLYTS